MKLIDIAALPDTTYIENKLEDLYPKGVEKVPFELAVILTLGNINHTLGCIENNTAH